MSDRGGVTQDVLLRIRAQNQATADFRAITAAVDDLTSALDKQTAAAARGEVKERELIATSAKLGKAITELKSIAALTETFKNFDKVLEGSQSSVDAVRARLAALQAAGARAGESQEAFAKRIEKTTEQLKKQEDNHARQLKTYRELGEVLRKAGVDTTDLSGAVARMGAVFDKAQAGVTQLGNATLNYSANLRAQTAEAEKAAAAQRSLAGQTTAATAAQKAAAEAHGRGMSGAIGTSMQVRNAALKAQREAAEAEDKVRAAANDKAKAREREAAARFDAYNDQRLAKVRKTVAAVEAEEAPRLRAGTPEGGRRTDAMGRVGRGQGQDVGLFGLRPYEWTNVGYQANDVLGGLVQGQNPVQILAQQGPQLLQIFGTAALKWLPLVGAAATAAAVAIGSLSRAFREINTERGFTASIMANPNAVGYDPEQLTKQTKQIRDMGVAYADARKFVGQAIEGNIGQGRITQIGQLAQDIADVKKVEFGEASKAIIEGLDGTQASLMKVVDAYHLLSDPERKRTNELFAQGKAQEAMTYALDRASGRMREAGKTATSPLTDTLRTLSRTWDDLLETLGKSAFAQAVVRGFTKVINAARETLEWLDKVILKLEDIRKKDADRVQSMQTGIDPMTGLPAGGGSVVRPVNPAEGTVGYAPIPPAGSVAGGGSVGLSAGQRGTNEAAVRDFLTARGYSPNAVAAIMGNISLESGFNPAATNATGHFGLAQWDKNRQAVLGGSTDINKQMELLDKEISQRIPGLKKSTESVENLTLQFEKAVEVSGGQGNAKRVSEAQRYAGTTGTGPASTGAPDPQKTAADARIKAAHEQRAIEEAVTEQQKRQAELAKITSEEREKGGTKEQQDAQIALRMRQVDQQLLERRMQREADDRRLAIDQARHLNEIRAAGQKAVDEAQRRGGGLLGFDQLEAARKRGESEEADRLKRLDDEQERLLALRRQLGQLDRGQDAKNATELSRALAAVDEQYQAIYDSQKKTSEQATDATKAQVEAMKPLIDASKERAKAEATLDSYRKQASSAERTRATLETTYNKLAEDGVISIGEAQQKIKEGYEATAGSITEAADALEKLIATDKDLSPERVAEYTAEVKRLRAEVQYVDPYLKGLRKTFVDSIGDNASKAFDTVAEAIGGVIAKTKTWADVWTSMKTAAANFFAGVLKDIATYIIKAQLAKALSALMPGLGLGGLFGETAAASAGAAATGTAASTGLSSGWTSIFSGAAAVAHEGGVVGNDNFPTRRVPAHWFASAPRYHTGTVVGLAPNERAAILQTGEEVLTADNPRHAKNWVGGGAAPDINIRNVLVADPNLVPSHMGSAKGERVIMNVLTRNAATVRQLVR